VNERDRGYYRYQRERVIRKRVRQNLHWFTWESSRGAPRPLEEVLAERLTPRVRGRFARWNGACSCYWCSKAWKYQRHAEKRGWQRLVREALAELEEEDVVA